VLGRRVDQRRPDAARIQPDTSGAKQNAADEYSSTPIAR
jgi:hypothetical protein